MGRDKAKHCGRGNGRVTQSAQTREILQGDYPPALKIEMVMATKGGRQQKRKSLACGRPAVHADIFVTHAALQVGAHPGHKGFVRYWTCHRFHAAGLTPELEAKLLGSLR
jgi:hypothetical protein